MAKPLKRSENHSNRYPRLRRESRAVLQRHNPARLEATLWTVIRAGAEPGGIEKTAAEQGFSRSDTTLALEVRVGVSRMVPMKEPIAG